LPVERNNPKKSEKIQQTLITMKVIDLERGWMHRHAWWEAGVPVRVRVLVRARVGCWNFDCRYFCGFVVA